MIHLLQAKNFRMLRSNSVELRPFHALVGQNATGKSTFLGVLRFISDALHGGVEHAVTSLAPSFYDLCFSPDESIELAVELAVAGSDRDPVERPRRLRYELEVGIDEHEGLRVVREHLFILPDESGEARRLPPSLFKELTPVVQETQPKHWRSVVKKTRDGKDYFRDEKTKWNNIFRFGLDRSALGSLPEDPDRFPLSIAARDLLRTGIRSLALDPAKMRLASPPGGQPRMALDGSNLPYVARALKQRDPALFHKWREHVAMAVEGLEDVAVREREDDKHLVLEARFGGQHPEPVPSWLLSDGTLRLMALTLLSYGEDGSPAIYLVEEPENGLHPLAIQVAFEALSEPSETTQVLCATHSPIFLAHTELDQILVFRRAPEGYAIVRRGEEIPELKEWTGEVSIADLFVTGVLS